MELDLKRFFEPRTVAVVGASARPTTGRYDYISWFTRSGFAGKLYPVNPRYREVHGYRCYPSLKEVPGTVDMVFLMVPAEMTVEILRETPAGKVKFAAVITSGFAEIGEKERERDLVAVCRSRGIRLLGPNCMGIYSRKGRLVQVPEQPSGSEAGEIGAMGQSGGISVNMVSRSINSGVAVKSCVSVGNQADLCLEDFLACYAEDDDIKVITAYVEHVKHGQRFMRMAREISTRKPIILWKGGATQLGSHAAASHTGALAVPRGIWEGVVRQTGILPAENLFDTINLSRALLWESLPQGPGVGLIAPGGGISVVMTDCSARAGLEVPLLSPGTRETLSRFIARVNTITENPIDLGSASYLPQTVMDTLAAMAGEETIHSFLLYLDVYPFKNVGARELGREFLKAVCKVRRTIDKPIYVAMFRPYQNFPEADEARREITDVLNELKIPYTMDLQSGVRMLKRVWEYARHLQARNVDPDVFRRTAAR